MSSKKGLDAPIGDVLDITEIKNNVKEPRLYKVLLHNDDYTTMDFVVHTLVTIFRKSQTDAMNLMFQVHIKGSAIGGIYPRDLAETKAAQVTERAKKQGFPFLATVESV